MRHFCYFIIGFFMIFLLNGCDQVNDKVVTNQAPIVILNAPDRVQIGQYILLDGSASYDPDLGDPVSFKWDLTDFPTGSYLDIRLSFCDTLKKISAYMELPGEYTIRLRVSDQMYTTAKEKIIKVLYPDGKELAGEILIDLKLGTSPYSLDYKTYIVATSVDTQAQYIIEPNLTGVRAGQYDFCLPAGTYKILAYHDMDGNSIFSHYIDPWGQYNGFVTIPADNYKFINLTIAKP